MYCKFINNGIAIAYQNIVRPCCSWKFDAEYQEKNQIENINFAEWHNNTTLTQARIDLENDIWPVNCSYCQEIENQGREDSTRLNGNRSYADFDDNDLVLEIRPGSVCNFACQTCSPAASSRVYRYYKNAGLLDQQNNINNQKVISIVDNHSSESFSDFNFLLPIASRLKTVIVLGGEPFYDKNCISFLHWWQKNTNASLVAFTNGSVIDTKFLENLKNKIVLVFSLDAVGDRAEYIRFGTKWAQVKNNFLLARQLPNVEVRVNITTSIYNFVYLDSLIEFLLSDWPDVVTFGPATENIFQEHAVPVAYREEIKTRLKNSIKKIKSSTIEEGQRWNTINALQSIIDNLDTVEYNQQANQEFRSFVQSMDRVKKINIKDYCPELVNYIN